MNTMNIQQTQKVRLQLESVLAGVVGELAEVAAGKPSVSTKTELNFIAAKLREMLESLNTERKIEIPGLWRIVTDTWPHTNKLRQQIVEAELNYERLK
jgi:hypothetical protein